MNCSCSFLFVALCGVALGQSQIPIKGSKNTRLTPSVHDAVAMGGVKDQIKCDAAGNLYTPVDRGYSGAFGSIVEIFEDGKQFRSFSLDAIKKLDTGHIEDFAITEDQGLYALVREVTKYSDLQEPVAFGSTYVVGFDSGVRVKSRTKLNADFADKRPTGLTVLKSGDFLVASYSHWTDGTLSMFADLLSGNGSLKRKELIPKNRTQVANSDYVSSMSVIRPMTIQFSTPSRTLGLNAFMTCLDHIPPVATRMFTFEQTKTSLELQN